MTRKKYTELSIKLKVLKKPLNQKFTNKVSMSTYFLNHI